MRQLFERVSSLFVDLARRHPDERIVAVTHGGVLDALHRFAGNVPLDRPRDFPIYNASLNFILCEDETLVD